MALRLTTPLGESIIPTLVRMNLSVGPIKVARRLGGSVVDCFFTTIVRPLLDARLEVRPSDRFIPPRQSGHPNLDPSTHVTSEL